MLSSGISILVTRFSFLVSRLWLLLLVSSILLFASSRVAPLSSICLSLASRNSFTNTTESHSLFPVAYWRSKMYVLQLQMGIRTQWRRRLLASVSISSTVYDGQLSSFGFIWICLVSCLLYLLFCALVIV